MAAFCAALALFSLPAGARPEGGRPPWREELRRDPGEARHDRRERWHEQRREDGDEGQRRPGGQRLSPEERRQLRQDVNEAGRELYQRRR